MTHTMMMKSLSMMKPTMRIFAVCCEGDTDVDDCFPTQITIEEVVVVDEQRPMIQGNKNAKDKTTEAFEEDVMAFHSWQQ